MPDYNNKVIYGNETLMDISEDTVTPQTLLSGETAHDRSGAPITGTATQGHTIKDSSTTFTQRSNLKFENATVTDDATNDQTIVNVGVDASTYSTKDSASTTINDTDYVPMSDANGNKKKSLWSNIKEKLKSFFLPLFKTTTLDVDNITEDGLFWVNGAITGAPLTSYGLLLNVKNMGTPFQMYFADNNLYVYKRYYTGGAWTAWQKIKAGYADSAESANGVKDYYATSMVTKFGYGSSGMAQSAVTWLGAWDASVSGEYRLRAVKQADLRVAYATDAGKTTYMSIPRVAESCNALPSGSTVRFREYTAGANYNLPSNAWYQILEIRSTDTNYGTQLALGMTTDAVYYRKYSGATWGSWKSLIDTNTTYNFGGTTFYSGNSGTAEHNCNNAIKNGVYYYTSNGPSDYLGAESTDGALYVQAYSDSWVSQIAQDYRSGAMFVRAKKNGTWTGWSRIADSGQNASQRPTPYVTIGYLSGTTVSTAKTRLRASNGSSDVSIILPSSGGTLALVSSSRRVKKNIRNMTEEEAQKLLDIDVIKFDYKDNWGAGEKNRAGFIAEDVLNILPETVHIFENYDPNLPVDDEYNFPPEMDYQRFVPYLVKMVQMQQEQINELKEEIKALKED